MSSLLIHRTVRSARPNGRPQVLDAKRRNSTEDEPTEVGSRIDERVMRGRMDALHLFLQQRAEAGAALADRIPGPRLLVPGPVDPAQIVRHRKLRRGGE